MDRFDANFLNIKEKFSKTVNLTDTPFVLDIRRRKAHPLFFRNIHKLIRKRNKQYITNM